MVIKNDELFALGTALNELRAMKAKGGMAFRVAHAINILKPHFEAVSEVRDEIMLRYADGAPDDQGMLAIKVTEEFQREIGEHMEIELDITPFPQPLTEADITAAEVPVSADILLALGPMFRFPETEP